MALWKQLISMWLIALAVEAVLIYLTFHGEKKQFFWLIPYPNWRVVGASTIALFHDYPLIAWALLSVPLLTFLLTCTLWVNAFLARRA